MAEQLTAQEAAWLDELRPQVLEFKQNWQEWPAERRQTALGKMCNIAQQLHDSLKSRGLEPTHSKLLKQRRATDTQNPFYFNLHALEDLIGIVGRMDRPEN